MSERTVEQWSQDMKRAARRGLARELHRTMLKHALKAETRAKLLVSGKRLNVRTGALRSSIRGRVTGRGTHPSITLSAGGRFGSVRDINYARIHELGGTIVPTKGEFLTLRMEKRFMEDPPSGEGKFVYRRVKSVKVKAKHYLRDALRARMKPFRRDIVKAVERVLEGQVSRGG